MGRQAASPATDESTDGDGRAASRLAVRNAGGNQCRDRRSSSRSRGHPGYATFTATALPANANGIALLSGDGQSGQVGATPLALPLVVVVTDALGNPIPRFPVDWTVTGGGSVSRFPDPHRRQRAAHRSPARSAPAAGAQSTAASYRHGGLAGSPVTFTHTATAGTATGVIKVSGDNQSAQPEHRVGSAPGGAGSRWRGESDPQLSTDLDHRRRRRRGLRGKYHHRRPG